MYEAFFGQFGLQQNPFPVAPNPKKYFSTTAHDEALLQLVFGIQSRKGLMILTGEPGTGKTTILHYLLEWLRENKYSTAYVYHTLLTSEDLLRVILRDFGVVCLSKEKGDMLAALGDWLLQRRRAGDCPVILIDEAQALTSRTLEELRMLLNLEVFGVKLVQLVLAGQPRLERRLKRKEMTQLRERVMCHCRLPALTLPETVGYIGQRMTQAGSHNQGSFPTEVVEEIHRYSRGIPRVIHLLCERALLTACADGRDTVCIEDVSKVAQEFDLRLFRETEGPVEEVLRVDTFTRLMAIPRLAAGNGEAPRKTEAAQSPVRKWPVAGSPSAVNSSIAQSSPAVVETLPEPEERLDEESEPDQFCDDEDASKIVCEDLPSPAYVKPTVLPIQEPELQWPFSLADRTIRGAEKAFAASVQKARELKRMYEIHYAKVEVRPTTRKLWARTVGKFRAMKAAKKREIESRLESRRAASQMQPRRDLKPTGRVQPQRAVKASMIAPVARVAPADSSTGEEKSAFVQYWRGVGKSFLRDLHAVSQVQTPRPLDDSSPRVKIPQTSVSVVRKTVVN
jgi:general secretion pathway protein A